MALSEVGVIVVSTDPESFKFVNIFLFAVGIERMLSGVVSTTSAGDSKVQAPRISGTQLPGEGIRNRQYGHR